MWQFCKFEIKYRLKHISPYVYTFILCTIAFFSVVPHISWFGANNVMNVSFGIVGGDLVAINSPYFIYSICTIFFLLSIFIIAAFANQTFSKDFESKFYNILFTKPIKKHQYLLGNFIGNFLVMMGVILSGIIIYGLSTLIPGIDEDKLVSSRLSYYLEPIFVIMIPNLLFVSAFFYAGVIATKKTATVFVMAFLLYGLSIVSEAMVSNLKYEVWVTLIDPFGLQALALATKGWTPAMMNSLTIGLPAYLILNRIIWLSFGTLTLLFAWKKFSVVTPSVRNAPKSCRERIYSFPIPNGTQPNQERINAFPTDGVIDNIDSLHTQTHQFLSFLRLSLRQIFKSPIFYFIVVIALINLFVNQHYSGMWHGTGFLPVTHIMVNDMMNNTPLYLFLLITFFAGELLWISRDKKFYLIEDVTPYKNIISYLAKYSAMAIMLAFILFMAILTGILVQTVKGYFNFEIGVYFQLVFGTLYLQYLIILFVVFFVHNLINHKYAAHFVFILLVLGYSIITSALNLDHPLWTPFYLPDITYSDMVGIINHVPRVFWYTLYAFGISLLLAGFTVMTWRRGITRSLRGTTFPPLSEGGRGELHTRNAFTIITLIVTLIAMGVIFYNVNIVDEYFTSKQTENFQIDYEMSYKHFERQNQPKIQDIKVDIELYPKQGSMIATGTYLIENVGNTSIDTLFVHYHKEYTKKLEIMSNNNALLVKNDKNNYFYLYKFTEPLAPGEDFTLNFEVQTQRGGFFNWGFSYSHNRVRKNGTFINSGIFPTIGYNDSHEISNQKRRKKLGLPEKSNLMPETTDSWGVSRNYVSSDGDWITFTANISTSSDQIALAPGELLEFKAENGRNYYTYGSERMLNFYAFMSARYDVKKDTVTTSSGQTINLELYYHPTHKYNLTSMMNGMKESLEYLTSVFGEYPYTILRVAEFPRVASFAQAFPALIPFSENIGFIADIKEDKIDTVFHVTAHEVAHQWWAHKLIGGYTRGTIMLSESFTEYSSLMVVKHNYSDKLYREQLRYKQNEYITGRSGQNRHELPLTQVERQDYIFYHKGMLVLNAAARLLGEDVLNNALSEFMETYKFTTNPYTNSLQFMEILRVYTPDEHKETIDDMFNKIVLYDHTINNITSELLENGLWQITVDFATEKIYFDDVGKPENIEWTGWLEVALLDENGDLFQLENIRVTQRENQVQIVSSDKPAEILLDPYVLTIDITPFNNREKVR